jgi:hypothetical protein
MESFFAAIGFLCVVGWLLWHWTWLDDRPRFNDGSLMNDAQVRDWKRVQDARREEELKEELARLQHRRGHDEGTTNSHSVKPQQALHRESESDARNTQEVTIRLLAPYQTPRFGDSKAGTSFSGQVVQELSAVPDHS